MCCRIFGLEVPPRVGLLLALGLIAALLPATAATGAIELDWTEMSMQLIGGLAIFLLGLDLMADALKAVAGERMKIILARLTTNRLLGALSGAVVTAVIQSSSVTTVLVVGFVTAQLMTLTQAVGVIMGANIGSTITAQIIAFKVTQYALPMIAIGFSLQFFFKREAVVSYGRILLGLGLLFFGMAIMGEGMRPLRDYAPFLQLMHEIRQPLLAIMVGTIFTGLVQSSAVTTGIIITMASQGLVDLETGIAISFGANIGTCITAMLAAIGKPRAAIRAALAHVIFNIVGVLVWLAFIPELAQLVTQISPVSTAIDPAARLAADVPRQIANAHTVFNVANTLLFIGASRQLARLIEWLLPERPPVGKPELKPKYLDPLLLTTPALALDASRRELKRIGDRVDDMLNEIMPAVIDGDAHKLDLIAAMDNEVDVLHGFVIRYLGDISKTSLSEAQTHELIRLMEATNNLENVGDVIETNLVALGRQRISSGIAISERTRRVLTELHENVAETLREAVQAVTRRDLAAAERVIARKDEINDSVDRAYRHQAQRLVAEEPGRLSAYRIEIDMIEFLKRVYYHAKRIAKTVADEPLARDKTPAPALAE